MPTAYGQVAGRNHGYGQRLTRDQECEPTMREMSDHERRRREGADVDRLFVGTISKKRYRMLKAEQDLY